MSERLVERLARSRGGRRVGHATTVVASAEPTEELAYVADQQARRFHRGEVAAAVEVGPVDDGVAVLGVAADGDILGERGDAGRRGGPIRVPGAGVHVLVVHVRRGGAGS